MLSLAVIVYSIDVVRKSFVQLEKELDNFFAYIAELLSMF